MMIHMPNLTNFRDTFITVDDYMEYQHAFQSADWFVGLDFKTAPENAQPMLRVFASCRNDDGDYVLLCGLCRPGMGKYPTLKMIVPAGVKLYLRWQTQAFGDVLDIVGMTNWLASNINLATMPTQRWYMQDKEDMYKKIYSVEEIEA